jgi:extradiol dioxygenase
MDIFGIAYMGYESPNYKEMAEYMPEVFGFGLNTSSADETTYLQTDDLNFRVAIHPGEQNRFVYLGLEMKDKWEWENGIERLRSNGFEVEVGNEDLEALRGCFGVAQFRDPGGWPHELVYGQREEVGSFSPGRPHAGFQTPTYGLGHTVLVASDKAELEHFAADVMEYHWYVQGIVKGLGSFWRCNKNNLSHNVAYFMNPAHVYGDTTSSLPHIGVYCKTLDDVGIAYDHVQSRNPEAIQMTLGRHMQDPVISFYSNTPAGFTVEYIWGEDLDIPHDTYVERQSARLSLWGHKLPDGSTH